VCIPGGRVMQTRNADIHFLFGLACRPDLWDAAHFDGVSGLRLCPAVRQRVLILGTRIRTKLLMILGTAAFAQHYLTRMGSWKNPSIQRSVARSN